MSAETTQEAAGFVCVYSGPADECWSCGGWTKAGGGPFAGDPKFCSEDCYADYAERLRERAQEQELLRACCPECGYDRQEHAPDCSASAEVAR